LTIDPDELKMLDQAVASLEGHGAPMDEILTHVAARDQARQRAAEEVACVLVDGLAQMLGRRAGT
jgi:hypothetical protein